MSNFWKTLKKPITILAPMDDVTDVVFREVIADTARPDVFFTEFTSTDALFTKGHESAIRRLQFTENQRPIVAQIWGNKPENFERAAKFIEELGVDGIDINFGCPVTAVTKRKAGAALINEIELVGQIIDATKKGSPNLPLSIKTRLDTTPELTNNWLSFLLSKNIAALTLHGRTANEMSKGMANWEEIAKAVEIRNKINPEAIVIGNGDVKNYADVLEKCEKYSVDGGMIGRGIFHNPWVFEKTFENGEIKEHSKEEHIDLLIKHTKLFHNVWGKTKNFEIMKKFFKIYVREFHGADELRQKLMETKGYEEVTEIINSNKN